MAQLAEIANVRGYQPGPALTAAGGVRSATLGDLNLYATMQGQRVLTEHLYAMAYIYGPVMVTMTEYFGNLMAAYAKELHFPNIDTGETYDSIMASPVMPMPSGAAIQVSVGTEQARFLEFGWVHHLTGQYMHFPFMIPAADAVAPMYVDALQQFMQFTGWRKFFTGPAAQSGANEVIGSVRNLLYSYSKWAGDIQVLGFPGLSASRGRAIAGARVLGNVQAAQQGTIVSRIGRLGVGRLGGSIIRTGSFTGPSALSGPAGRIYNRISGRAFGGSLAGINLR